MLGNLIGEVGESLKKKKENAMYNKELTRAHWTRHKSGLWTVTQSEAAQLIHRGQKKVHNERQ